MLFRLFGIFLAVGALVTAVLGALVGQWLVVAAMLLSSTSSAMTLRDL